MNDILDELSTVLPQLNAEDDFERICAILIPEQPLGADEDEFEPPEASLDMIERYHDFLIPKLPVGLRLTGREDMGYFGWEERFIWGAGNPDDYERLKRERGSYKDKFLFLKLDEYDEEVGILVKVRRINDKKLFTIPLADLDTCTEKCKEHRLIDDYATWIVNF